MVVLWSDMSVKLFEGRSCMVVEVSVASGLSIEVVFEEDRKLWNPVETVGNVLHY